MAKPIDIISRALKDIGALEAGEVPTADAAQDAFDMLNDMLDQWSNESMMIYNYTEIVFPVVSGQINYTLGPSGNVGSEFDGDVLGDILTVNSVTSGSITLNQTITAPLGIPENTQIISFLTGGGGVDNAPGTYKLNKAAPNEVLGNFSGYFQKPLSINSAFVRINTNSNGINVQNGGLDYPVAVLGLDEYELIGLKTLNGPWPKALYYNPGDSLGNLFVWPNPSQGEMHIFADTIFTRYNTMYDDLAMPQGYTNAMRWCLAEFLMPMYGKSNPQQIAMITSYANVARAKIKRTNMKPQQVSRCDDVITNSKARDAGWILSGGFFN